MEARGRGTDQKEDTRGVAADFWREILTGDPADDGRGRPKRARRVLVRTVCGRTRRR